VKPFPQQTKNVSRETLAAIPPKMFHVKHSPQRLTPRIVFDDPFGEAYLRAHA
jgi:hypothetical protein